MNAIFYVRELRLQCTVQKTVLILITAGLATLDVVAPPCEEKLL